MKRETGDRNSEIWLLGDSNPKSWHAVLKSPFDPRHPARHNVWTPVLEVIQDRVFRECRKRVDTSPVFTRNAVGDPTVKPSSRNIEWKTTVEKEVQVLRETVHEYRPGILFSFGAFSLEFARRALRQEPERAYGYWGTRKLRREFRRRIDQFNLDTTNLLPLLHVSITRGRFIQSHEYFCDEEGANYFESVGSRVAEMLIEHRHEPCIWIES
jgi:hypothetical protein